MSNKKDDGSEYQIIKGSRRNKNNFEKCFKNSKENMS